MSINRADSNWPESEVIEIPAEIRVTFGQSTRVFYTEYHAEQFVRALQLNGTQYTISR